MTKDGSREARRSAEPRITVGFPVYNGGASARRALQSLAEQDHPSFEVLISDNGSTDGETVEICSELSSRDSRFRYVRQPRNRGARWNFNYVALAARSPYFMWGAHDDLWRADCLRLSDDYLTSHPDAALVSCSSQPILANGEPYGHPYTDFSVRGETPRARFAEAFRNSHCHVAIYGLMRTSHLAKTRAVLDCIAQDHIFVMEMALLGKVLELPAVCAFKRVSPEGAAGRSRRQLAAHLNPGSTSIANLRFVRARVAQEGIKAVLRSDLSASEKSAIVGDVLAIYAKNYLKVDVKEEARLSLSESLPQVLRLYDATKSALLGRA